MVVLVVVFMVQKSTTNQFVTEICTSFGTKFAIQLLCRASDFPGNNFGNEKAILDKGVRVAPPGAVFHS